MATIEIIKYEPEHVDEIMKHPRCWEMKTSQHPDWNGWKQYWKTQGPAYSIRVNGMVIGSAGVIIEGNAGEAWAVLANGVEMYAKSVYAAIKRGFESILRENKLDEVQMFVDPGFEEGKRMARHLGFMEGEMGLACGMEMIRFWRKC